MSSPFEKLNETNTNDNFKITSTYNIMTKTDRQIMEDFSDSGEPGRSLEENINRDSQVDVSRKTMYQRMFSKMEAGSLRGSILAISSLALGTGCLALPISFGRMSFVCALIALIIGAVAAYWSLVIMIEASRKTESADYSRVVLLSLGPKLAKFLDINLLVYCVGILISYQVIVYQLIGSFVYDVGFAQEYSKQKFDDEIWETAKIKFPIMYGICLILIPLCLLKDISKMRIASLFSIISLIYSITVIIIECPWYYSNYVNNIYDPNDPKTHINWYDFSTGFDEHLYFFKGFASMFFAYTCHTGAFPVFKTLKNNVARRINKVFQRSLLLNVFVYISVGICGYLTQPINTPELIINRNQILKNDLAMIIARLLMAFNLILSTPANYNAFRLSILEFIFGNTEITNQRNYLTTIPTILITCLIGALYNKIIAYISILGGFCSVVIAFLFPGLLYVKNNDYKITHWKNISTLIIISILCTIGYIAGIMTIVDIFRTK